MDALAATLKIASSGLNAQSARLRVVSQNLANTQSTGETAGAEPYKRKLINFTSHLDRGVGVDVVKVDKVTRDDAPFRLVHEPGHPAADENGYVKYPNVNVLVEMADMREANRTYEANLQVMKQASSMIATTLDLLRNG